MVRDRPSHLLLLLFSLDPVFPVGSMRRERDGAQRRDEERAAVCLPLTLSLWEPKMGSVSRTPTCCQETNVRMRGRDDEKDRKGRGNTTACCESVVYMVHAIYHLLPEMQFKYTAYASLNLYHNFMTISFSPFTRSDEKNNSSLCLNNYSLNGVFSFLCPALKNWSTFAKMTTLWATAFFFTESQ